MNNGMTYMEEQTFRNIKRMAESAQTAEDIRAVKRMTSKWIMQAKSEKIRARRRGIANAIPHAHSQIAE